MGGSYYSDALYTDRMTSHKRAGTSVFEHDALIRKTGRVSVHESLLPSKLNSLGQLIRESRDSAEHPQSNAVAILFDVTGSMRNIPRQLVEKLPQLMGALIKKGYLSDPQVLFGAIGDAYSDKAPLQIGQFESGNEMDSALTNIYLEGNGGGQFSESYDLGMHFLAEYAAMDCLEKRGKKGYCFLIGDENVYPNVNKEQVERLIGEPIQADIPVEEVLERLRSKFEVFWIYPRQGSNYSGERGRSLGIHDRLQDLFGQQLIWLDDPNDVCEVIVATIGLNEGYDINKISSDLADLGANSKAIVAINKSLTTFASKKVVAVSGGVEDSAVSVERL